MKRKFKFMWLLALALTFITLINFKTNAITQSNTSTYTELGKNAIMRMTNIQGSQWNNIEIVTNRSLYDFADKLIGYSIDFKNKETGEKAYVILNTNIDDELISEFAIGRYSPYTEKQTSDNNTCIYDGVLSYYSKSSNTYTDIRTDKKLEKTEINSLIEKSKNKEYKSTNPIKSKKTREEVYSNSTATGVIIPNVRKLCRQNQR